MTAPHTAVRKEAPPALSPSGNPDQKPAPPAEDLSVVQAPRGWIASGAMATGLILGVLLAGSFGIGSNIHATGDILLAGGPLAQRLTGELSGRGVGPSFWSREGVFCRAFALSAHATPDLSGIACREPAGWRIRIIAENNDASGLPGNVTAVLNNLMVGIPLDGAQEEQARRQAWRPR